MITKEANVISDFFWKPDAGPAENILGLVEYGYMFLGGMWGRIAITLATVFGVSLRDLGKKLDEMFNLATLEDLANAPDDISAEMMFKGSMLKHKEIFTKMGRGYTNQQTTFNLLSGLFNVLKKIAVKIMTGGLLSFLTLTGIQAAKKSGGDDQPENEDSNNTTEKQIKSTKNNLESAIRDALSR